MLRGNHETYVASFDNEPAWQTTQFAPIAWAVGQLGKKVRRELGALPFSLNLPEAPDLLFVHASLRSDRDNINAYTTDGELETMFSTLDTRYVVRGHDHIAAAQTWKALQLITNGSVGIPVNSVTEAQYLVLENDSEGWQPTFHSVPYDVDAVLEQFHDTGYLDKASPMAYLSYREFATATLQLIP